MKNLLSKKNISLLITSLSAIIIVKLFWILISLFLLIPYGTGHQDKIGGKNPFYRIHLSEKGKVIKKKQVISKEVSGNISDFKLISIYRSGKRDIVGIKVNNKVHFIENGELLKGFTFINSKNKEAIFKKDNKIYKVGYKKMKTTSSYKESSSPVYKQNPKLIHGEITDAGDHKIIDRSLINHYIKNEKEIYKNIGIRENRVNGKMKGFKITFIKSKSPFSKLGLKRGDILKSVNGQDLDNYGTAMNIYKNIDETQDLVFTIIRNNKEMELTNEIN